jgi:phage host-nuclease inhibitor protein Gam
MKLEDIENLTRAYAVARKTLASVVGKLQEDIDAVKRRRMQSIKDAVAVAADAHGTLVAAIEQAPASFVRPRTITIAGIKVGMRQVKASLAIEDEAAVIARIRERLPADQAELLIRRKESVDRNALVDLSEADLRRLGIELVPERDEVYIKPTDGEVDKLVNALLKEAEIIEEQAA